jgi:pectin methylesterase-like acyl-CoA thioesterase
MVFALLSMAFPLGVFGSQALAQEPKTWYVDDDKQDYPDADFTRIQDAVDAASAGDTIIVRDGTYTENVDVNKRLTIRFENGSGKTIVQAANHAFEITTNVNMYERV